MVGLIQNSSYLVKKMGFQKMNKEYPLPGQNQGHAIFKTLPQGEIIVDERDLEKRSQRSRTAT